MFGVGSVPDRSWSYLMYHEEDGQSFWHGLRGLQGVGGDEAPGSLMNAFATCVKERKDNYLGGQGHTRGTAIEVEGDGEDEEDKDQPKDRPKDKSEGKDKTKDEPKEMAKDKGQRKEKV